RQVGVRRSDQKGAAQVPLRTVEGPVERRQGRHLHRHRRLLRRRDQRHRRLLRRAAPPRQEGVQRRPDGVHQPRRGDGEAARGVAEAARQRGVHAHQQGRCPL
ncbi:hypothetical protein KEM52_006331, partial [Ascosphaera acerosa]